MTSTRLAERVSDHMQRFAETNAARWTVAADHRDNTAAVVWRAGSDPTLPRTCRGIVLWRWLCSLRDAGFEAHPRTDMEIFGRPDEESPDGRAYWLHVTDWKAPQATTTA